jgi:hypothetical protein
MISVSEALALADRAWKKSRYNLRELPRTLQTIQLIGQLEFEVTLGGVLGWLTNSSGKYAPETSQALEAIGASQCAAIVRRILAFFPNSTPALEDAERVRQIESVLPLAGDAWRELGDALLEWPEDISRLLELYISAHESDFVSELA